MPRRQFQHVASARRTRLQRLQWVLQIVDRACQRRQVEHTIDRSLFGNPVQLAANICFDKPKCLVVQQMLNVLLAARDQVVDRHNLVARFNQPVANV